MVTYQELRQIFLEEQEKQTSSLPTKEEDTYEEKPTSTFNYEKKNNPNKYEKKIYKQKIKQMRRGIKI